MFNICYIQPGGERYDVTLQQLAPPSCTIILKYFGITSPTLSRRRWPNEPSHVDRIVDTIVPSILPRYNRGWQKLWPIKLPNWGPKKIQGPPLSLPRSPSTSGRSAAAPTKQRSSSKHPGRSAYLTFFSFSLFLPFSVPPPLLLHLERAQHRQKNVQASEHQRQRVRVRVHRDSQSTNPLL